MYLLRVILLCTIKGAISNQLLIINSGLVLIEPKTVIKINRFNKKIYSKTLTQMLRI